MFTSRKITTMGGNKLRDDFSLTFDGSNDYVDFGADSSIAINSSAFTISFWVNFNALGTYCLIGKGTSLSDGGGSAKGFAVSYLSNKFYLDCHEGVGTYHRDTARTDTLTIDTGRWYHITAVRPAGNADGRAIYVDGLDKTASGKGDNNDTDDLDDGSINLFAAKAPQGSNRYSAVKISDIALYKGIAMNEAQVRTLYNGREPYNHAEGSMSTYLSGWWRMGDGLEHGSGTTIFDMSTNTNNGTMTNMAADDFIGDTP